MKAPLLGCLLFAFSLPCLAQRPAPPPAPPAANPAPQPPGPPAQIPPAAPNNAGLGQPFAGLSDADLANFLDGQAEFATARTPADGLGPIFNDVSCMACHSSPAEGGASRRTVTRFGFTDASGNFDPLASRGGSLLQARAIAPAVREVVPAEANTTARRLTTPLFGAGLLEAIPDSEIEANAQAAKPPGIAGKAAIVTDPTTGLPRVGRFGWKAQQPTLLAFSADASVNEIGITNRFFPTENAPDGNVALLDRFNPDPGVNDVIDPADGKGAVDRAADFMRLLAPPRAQTPTGPAVAGRQLFVTATCAACHTPTMTTGDSPVPALAHQTVALYSDLLLHDMGSLGDGIAQGAAGPREMRTAPLWGLRTRPVWLHDGRATTVAAAILAHDGEGAGARQAFQAMTPQEQQQLLAFLNTL